MTILVVGGTGATGRLLVGELLSQGHKVRVIVRSLDRLPEALRELELLEGIEASLLDLSDAALAEQVAGCDAVASCLGHNLTLRGVFGSPRRLVADATRRLCDAVRSHRPQTPVRFVLMSSAGVRHRGLAEPIGFAQRCVLGLLRTVVPPHADNEQAAEYLRTQIGASDPYLAWVAVRPDALTDDAEASEYDAYASPTRSAIFNSGQTSRANVAHFMASLMTDDDKQEAWKGRMPVIYNRDPQPKDVP